MSDSLATKIQRLGGIDPDLEWLLLCGDAALGARGTLAGVVAVLEHGGQIGGVPNTDLYGDEQLGWGRHVFGDVERYRWLSTAWHAVDHHSQGMLALRVLAPSARFRSDEGFGAKDRYVEGSDAAPGGSAATRSGVEARLGEFASLALYLAPHPERLAIACEEPDPQKTNTKGAIVVDRDLQRQRARLRGEAVKTARDAFLVAHVVWLESKAGADPMRPKDDRRQSFGALPPLGDEIARVRDVIVPTLQSRGGPSLAMAGVALIDVRAAEQALKGGELGAMVRAHQALLEWR